jgi:hypothetical protein
MEISHKALFKKLSKCFTYGNYGHMYVKVQYLEMSKHYLSGCITNKIHATIVGLHHFPMDLPNNQSPMARHYL